MILWVSWESLTIRLQNGQNVYTCAQVVYIKLDIYDFKTVFPTLLLFIFRSSINVRSSGYNIYKHIAISNRIHSISYVDKRTYYFNICISIKIYSVLYNKCWYNVFHCVEFYIKTWLHCTILFMLHASNIYSRSTGRVGGRQGTITNCFLWPRLTRHIFILWPPFYAEWRSVVHSIHLFDIHLMLSKKNIFFAVNTEMLIS